MQEVSGLWEAVVTRWTDGSSGPEQRGRRRDELWGEEKRRTNMSLGKRCEHVNVIQLRKTLLTRDEDSQSLHMMS